MAAQYGTGEKTLKLYLIGLVLCLILTCASFGVVAYHPVAGKAAFICLSVLAIAQLFVQVIFFLRLNTNTPEARWNVLSFVFAIFVVVILVGGTLWIMYNLNYNMVH